MNKLAEIIAFKESEVKERSKIITLDKLKESQRLYSIRDFKGAIKGKQIQIIAEIKRKSPSAGNINLKIDPVEIAKCYANNGASCISILTDYQYFGGQLEYIQRIKNSVSIPVLRKDFIITEYQVWESFYSGSDAILLIGDAINLNKLKALYELASELGLHVLIEAHNTQQLKEICNMGPAIIGINCRNLMTMETNINLFEQAIDYLPEDAVRVAESGITNYDDLEYIYKLGYNAALVGTSLMQSDDPGLALFELIHNISS